MNQPTPASKTRLRPLLATLLLLTLLVGAFSAYLHFSSVAEDGTRRDRTHQPGPSRPALDPPATPPVARQPAAGGAVEGGLGALVDELLAATQSRDGLRVHSAIAVLSKRVCGEAALAPELLNKAKALAGEGHIRAAAGVVYALGRCGREEVLDVLLALVRDVTLAGDLRNAAILALGQRREPDLKIRANPGIAKGDTILDAPIEETSVKRVLMELLVGALDQRNSDRNTEAVVNGLYALGASVGDGQVYELLRRIAASEPGHAITIYAAMQAAGPVTGPMEDARTVALNPKSPHDVASAAVAYLARVDQKAGLELVMLELEGGSSSPRRIVALIEGVSAVGRVGAADVPLMERLSLLVWTWAKEHREVSEPGGRTTIDARHAAFGFLRTSLTWIGKRSFVVQSPAAEALAWRLSVPDDVRRKMVERMTNEMTRSGGRVFASTLLTEVDRGDLPQERIAGVLAGVKLGLGAGKEWEEFHVIVDRLLARISEPLREEVSRELR